MSDRFDPTFDPLRDRIVVARRIHTLDPELGTVRAVAVRGGRILAAGATDEVAAVAAPGAERIDLEDAVVTPGFHDAHVHLGMFSRERLHVDLSTTASLAEAVARLRSRAESRPAGTWILGGDWDHTLWGGELPRRDVRGNSPVLLTPDRGGGRAGRARLRRYLGCSGGGP